MQIKYLFKKFKCNKVARFCYIQGFFASLFFYSVLLSKVDYYENYCDFRQKENIFPEMSWLATPTVPWMHVMGLICKLLQRLHEKDKEFFHIPFKVSARKRLIQSFFLVKKTKAVWNLNVIKYYHVSWWHQLDFCVIHHIICISKCF